MVASGTYEDIVADRVRARAATAAAAIDRLEALEERDAASAVLAPGADGTGLHLDPAPMPSTSTISERSELEARRIITARMLAGRASALESNHPIVTRARNRPGHRVLLAYRLACLDPRGLHSWDCLVAIIGPATPDLNTSIERLLMSTDASSLAFDALRGRLDDEIRWWRRAAAAVLRRDRAIASALRRTRAELSAALVQPELFSKRAERALTPQLQLLDASLGKLRAASSEMSAVGRIRAESSSPVFAAVLPLQ